MIWNNWYDDKYIEYELINGWIEYYLCRYLSIKEFLGEEEDYAKKKAELAFDIIDK